MDSKQRVMLLHYGSVLSIDNVKDVLTTETEIAVARCQDGTRKRFTFNAWKNEYSVWKGDMLRVATGGQALEELINVYNDL